MSYLLLLERFFLEFNIIEIIERMPPMMTAVHPQKAREVYSAPEGVYSTPIMLIIPPTSMSTAERIPSIMADKLLRG